jgi:hypothetical protein
MKCALVFALLAGAPALQAQACTALIEGGKRIESARHTLAYRTDPAKVVVGKPFAVVLAICPRESGARIEEVQVDGHMPEHRHGMNYKASVKALGEPGRYRAEGLMFHMPGKWEFLFDVRDAKGMERLKQEFSLK